MARDVLPGPIATYKKWQSLGRQVKKGEKAITLCMPITAKKTREKSDGSEEESVFRFFTFRAKWFVFSQTEPIEGMEYNEEELVPPMDWDKELALKELGIKETSFNKTNGNVMGFATPESEIAINPINPLPHKTLFHELAHIVLGHTKERGYEPDSEHTPRSWREVEAESVAFILLNVLGLEGMNESRGYIQHWLGEGKEIPEKNALKIFSAADKILKAGRVKKDDQSEE
jgi:antirestriction protein ArdC